jgi:hypothetical protein
MQQLRDSFNVVQLQPETVVHIPLQNLTVGEVCQCGRYFCDHASPVRPACPGCEHATRANEHCSHDEGQYPTAPLWEVCVEYIKAVWGVITAPAEVPAEEEETIDDLTVEIGLLRCLKEVVVPIAAHGPGMIGAAWAVAGLVSAVPAAPTTAAVGAGLAVGAATLGLSLLSRTTLASALSKAPAGLSFLSELFLAAPRRAAHAVAQWFNRRIAYADHKRLQMNPNDPRLAFAELFHAECEHMSVHFGSTMLILNELHTSKSRDQNELQRNLSQIARSEANKILAAATSHDAVQAYLHRQKLVILAWYDFFCDSINMLAPDNIVAPSSNG